MTICFSCRSGNCFQFERPDSVMLDCLGRGSTPILEISMQTHSIGQVRLPDLKFSSCRWPLGGTFEKAKFFCGEPTIGGCSWCEEHRKRVYARIALHDRKEQRAR